jgi:hypothetical protein
VDTDGDRVADSVDADDDGDGVLDISDAFPLDPTLIGLAPSALPPAPPTPALPGHEGGRTDPPLPVTVRPPWS